MKTAFCLATILASASAFAPASKPAFRYETFLFPFSLMGRNIIS